MANPLDQAIAQQLESLKAANMLGGPAGPGMAPMLPGPGPSMVMTAPGPGGPMMAAPGMIMGPGPVPLGPPQLAGGPPGMAAAGPPPGGQKMLSVAIDNLPFRYQLTEPDLHETFQRWGPIQVVQVSREGAREVGVIHFADPVDASDAQRQLNGQVCGFDGATGTLAVLYGPPEQLSPPMLRPVGQFGMPPAPMPGPPPPGAPMMGGRMGGPPPPAPGPPPPGLPGTDMHGASAKSAPAAPPPAASGGGRGYSCKLVVQYESLHPEFPTVQKILGERGANVEHLRSHAACMVQLRGKGSGTMEPDSGREAAEPMFLWISADAAQNGKAALEMAQDLLKSVYEEHQVWCQRHGLAHPEFLEPTVIEGSESSAGPPPPGPGGYGPAPGAPAFGHGKGPY